MPFAIACDWPPHSVAALGSYGQRGTRPLDFAWPPGGTLQFAFSEASAESAAPAAEKKSGAASSYEAVEPHGGCDGEAARKVVERARTISTLPASSNANMEALRHQWIALHGMEEGLNIY